MLDGFSAVTYALCKKYVNGAIQQVVESFSEGMHFQGSVPTKDNLPDNPAKGDLYIIVDTGTKVVWDGNAWIEFEQNFYTKEEVDAKLQELEAEIPSIEGLATKSSLESEINRAKDSENEIRESIPTKTSQLTNDSGFLTEHQDISGKADLSYVNDQLNLKQDKLIPGDNITIVNNKINAIVPSLEGYATEQWVEDKHYLTEHQSLDNYYVKGEVDNLLSDKQDTLIAGDNITIIDNVISAIGGSSGVIGRDFTTNITVGHLRSGTHISANMKIADLLYKMLYESTDDYMVYYGVSNNIPSGIEGLTQIEISKTDIGNQRFRLPKAVAQYLVIACEKAIELSNWKVIIGSYEFDLEFADSDNEYYNIYYINKPNPDIGDDGRITQPETEYKFVFKEA